MSGTGRIHIAHILHRLGVGGLENGVVNLVNCLPQSSFRHSVICLTDFTDFRRRISAPDVRVLALNKREGKDLSVYFRLWRVLRHLDPDIVHTRNLATIDCQAVAALAGRRCRIHGEHGRDISDLDGSDRKYRLLRRILDPIIHHYIPMSCDLELWLNKDIGIHESKITQIYNGVDTERFRRRESGSPKFRDSDFAPEGTVVLGSVLRFHPVKDPATLVRAFLHLRESMGASGQRLRLVLVGGGPLEGEISRLVAESGAADAVWLTGERDDIPDLLRGFDVFVLPSRREGISNTILEAMATGLPVVATNVGGNPELVIDNVTGSLCPEGDWKSMANVLRLYVEQDEIRRERGIAARRRVESRFSLDHMIRGYASLYTKICPNAPLPVAGRA